MKKLSFFLMAMLISVMSFAAESLQVTLDFSKNTTWGFPNGSSAKTTATKTYTNGDYSITLAGGGSGNGHYWNNQGYLMLGKSGATLTLPAFDFNTTKIVVVGRSGASASTLQNIYVGSTAVSTQTKGSAVTNTYAIAEDYQAAGNVYIFKVGSSHNSQIVKIEIYGEEGGEQGEKVDAPKFSVTETNFKEAFDLTISSAEGTTLKYTTDNTDPKTSATAVSVETNTVNVAIPAKSTVVKAVAVKGDLVSVVASTIYAYVNSPETAYTVAEAMEVIDAGLGLENELYVKGEISLIEKFDATYGSITYWIKDEEGNKFECYSGLGLNKAKFTKKEDLVVGSKVVVCGTMKKYNTTYEFNYNNYIVSLELPVVNHTITVSANPAEGGVVTGGGEFEETDEITVKAVANENYVFVNWTENDVEVSTEAEYTFEVLADRALVANFQVIPCTQATPVNWDAPIAAEANTDQWYAVNIASAIAAKKDIALTVANSGAAAVEVTVEAYANCPATEKIAGATSTINAGATKTTTVKYDEYLADQVEVVYLHVVTSGDLTVDAEVIEPCTQATAINWDAPIAAAANIDAWYAVNVESAIAAGKDLALTVSNPSTEAVEVSIEAYANCPATELIVKSTSTINAGATKTTTVKYDEYLADQVKVVYMHVTTKGGEIKVEAETVKFNVTATAENGTVEGAGIYEQGAEATLTATPAEGYEFVNWTSGETVVSTENPYKFTVTADVSLVANFKEKEVAPAKLYLTPNANWKKDNARFAAYFFGNGETWVSMTKVAGETGLYEVTIPTDKKYPNVIFCRMNPSASANNWNNKWNQTADLVIPTDGKNHYTVKENTWDKGGGTWSIWPIPTVKTYVDITITVTANAPASIKWANAGDKLADATEYVAMTAGENNTYTYTLAQVDEAKGVDYTIKVGDIVSTTQNTSKNVTVDFKNLLPQVAIEGIDGKWDSSNKMTVSDDYLTASITLPLAAKDHAWKLTIDAAWLGGSKFVITRTNNSVVVKEDAGGDGKLTADIAGDYVFTWTYATQTLTVTYPALPVKYNVTVTAENGTVTGAGTYEEGAEATLTATPAEGYKFVSWTADDVELSTENPYTFVVTADVALVANFELVPVVEPEKPEPTYTDNNLNPYAFGLESKLSADQSVLNVTYRLNNSKATDVDVVVYNGTEVVKVVAGTTNLGKNTVEIATADLPAGVELTWSVIVNGTSVEAPTAETKIYSFYHPSGLDIDINPENETFGMLLVNEGMHSVKSKTEGYVSAQFGAGIFAFTPSFDLIPNGELPGYNGGIEFTNTRADGTGTAYAPRRIRISEDGRIFVTSLNTDGNYLWEVNPDNLNEWTTVFKGTLNDQRELVDAEGNFVAAPNNGFDVKGSGENLQLAMYSVNLSGITAAAMSGFRLHEYNLGTATEWTTAPSKAIVEGKYAINYTGTQVEYDNEGGVWICSYRGTASDANPGLVHINAEGVEDAKLVWNNVRQAGIRFNKDFTKLVVAGNNGAAKKATIYTISKDANGAPVLTQEAVVDMAVVGNNLNDFAWDYAGNLYSCGNSSEKLAAWAMPYSGEVETPAASKYAFQLEGEAVEYTEIVMSNLVVTPYGEYDVLEASDAMTGIAVMLGVDADGKLVEGSEVTWNGTSMTILSSDVFTKTYSEDLATDVYNGKLVIEFYGEEMGLDLYMYGTGAASSVDVVITDANITVDEWGSYLVSAPWEDGILTIEVSDTEYEGFMMLEYTITEDDWYIWMAYTATVTTVDNVMTIEGEFTDNYTGTTYNVTISGNLPNGTGTGLEDATVTIKAVKKIQNGQLIIEKDGVQYNANGAQL